MYRRTAHREGSHIEQKQKERVVIREIDLADAVGKVELAENWTASQGRARERRTRQKLNGGLPICYGVRCLTDSHHAASTLSSVVYPV